MRRRTGIRAAAAEYLTSQMPFAALLGQFHLLLPLAVALAVFVSAGVVAMDAGDAMFVMG